MRVVVYSQEGRLPVEPEEGRLKEFQTAPTAKERARKKESEHGQEVLVGTLEPFIEAGKVEPLAGEQTAPVVSYVNPTYRLGLELAKKGFIKQPNKALWREMAPNKLVSWEGLSFVKKVDHGLIRAWLAPVGELNEKGQPLSGKWSGYAYVYPERNKISAGWKDTEDQAVDALLESVHRRMMTPAEAQEEQRKAFMARWPGETAHLHDIDLIYVPMLTAAGFKLDRKTPEMTVYSREGPKGKQYAIINMHTINEKPEYSAMWQPYPITGYEEIERAPMHAKYEDAFADLMAMVEGQKLKTSEEQQQAGVIPSIRLSPSTETAINRVLGEYVSRALNEARKLGTHGEGRGVPITARRIGHPFYHYDQKDLDDFLERYDRQIREESRKLGPWPGQKAAPMGTWKEKWRPLVKKYFREWFRVHYEGSG